MAALNFPDSPVSGQVFSSGTVTWQYNGSRWVILPAAPSPLLLATKSEALTNPATFMDTYAEFNLSDDAHYSFPTSSQLVVSGIHIKPDRAVNCYAYIYTYNVTDPSSPGNGRRMATTPVVASGGANWTQLGDLAVSVPVIANAGASWYMRLYGVAGGATAYGYAFSYVRNRYRNDG